MRFENAPALCTVQYSLRVIYDDTVRALSVIRVRPLHRRFFLA